MIRLLPLLLAWLLAATATAPRQRRRQSARSPRSPAARRWPDWVGSWPRLTGRQTPEFESKHEGDESEGDSVAIFGARVGLRCMPWEWLTVRAIHSRQKVNEWGERLWTHRDVVVECTRQQGKTLIIVLVILWRMTKYGRRIVYTAQRSSTAKDVYERTETVISRIPSLRKRLKAKPSWSAGRGLIVFSEKYGGGKCEFGPRSQDFGRGYTEVDDVFFDESYDIDPTAEANLTGAQSAAPNPQTFYFSTPPVLDVHPHCQTLSDMHRLGHQRAPDLYYALYAAPAEMTRDDPAAWAMAQPSYGVSTNEREIASKRRKAKTAAKLAIFDADYLGWGQYAPDELDGDTAIDGDVWAAREDPGPVLVGDYVLAVDREKRGRRRWAIVAGRRTEDGRVFGELGFWRSATIGEVASYLLLLVELWDPPAVIVDGKSDAAPLAPYMKELGIEMEVVGTNQLALACKGVADAIEGDDVAHSGQPAMLDAIESATKRELPRGDFAWDGLNIAPLVAFTFAYWGVLQFAKETFPMAAPTTGAPERGGDHDHDAVGYGMGEFGGLGVDLDVLNAGF